MDEQSEELNQSSGIFGEQKKGFLEKLKEGFAGFFGKLSVALSKIFVKKVPNEDSDFVGPMDHNIFTDEKTAADLVRHEATMADVTIAEDNGRTQSNEADGSGISQNQTGTRVASETEVAAGLGTGADSETEAEAGGGTETGAKGGARGGFRTGLEGGTGTGFFGKNKTANAVQNKIPEIFYPETPEDLVWLINKLPETVLTMEQKKTMGAAMSFDAKTVKEVMTPKDEVIIIHENDFMGPLTLSRLYKSGLTHFPVVGARGEIVGLIHTKTLFSLSVKETDRASAFLDKNVYYMSENYSLKEALAAFVRTSCHFFIVVDDHGKVTGLMSFKKLISMLAGELPETDFDQDQDLMSVVKHAREINETTAIPEYAKTEHS